VRAIVWRVENAYGGGPYRAGIAPYGKPERHPAPYDDFAALAYDPDNLLDAEAYLDLVHPYLFGFPTIAAAYAWWTREELEDLTLHGFRLERVVAAEVIVSDSGKQCMFRRAA
jgi:hypothetical protein